MSMPEWAKQVASLHDALDSLAIALEGTRLAVEAAKEAPRLINDEQLALNQVLHRWRGANCCWSASSRTFTTRATASSAPSAS